MTFKLLTEQEIQAGYKVKETEDFIKLYHHGWILATFNAHGATQESLRTWLDLIKSTLQTPYYKGQPRP